MDELQVVTSVKMSHIIWVTEMWLNSLIEAMLVDFDPIAEGVEVKVLLKLFVETLILRT